MSKYLPRQANREPGLMVHTSNASTWEANTEDYEFEANLGYKVRSCLKNELID
jgi:hypothetical protein